MLQEFFNSYQSETFDLISGFGIVNFAKALTPNMEDVTKQLMYAYYRDKEMIPANLLNTMQDYIDEGSIILDEDYNGFNDNEFIPAGEMFSLAELFANDQEFKEQAILFWQLTKTITKKGNKRARSTILNANTVSINNLLERYYNALEIKSRFESQYGPDCWASVKTDMLFDFRDSGKDLDLFRAYMAIKSIIGPHRFTATTRNVILMRMMGCKSNQALNDFIKSNKAAKEYHALYSRSDKAMRYHFDKLFESLLSLGFIKSKIFERKISRKTFISVTLSYDELATEIINFHNKHKHQKDEERAIEKIRATI